MDASKKCSIKSQKSRNCNMTLQKSPPPLQKKTALKIKIIYLKYPQKEEDL
jgi:hypothetical protein